MHQIASGRRGGHVALFFEGEECAPNGIAIAEPRQVCQFADGGNLALVGEFAAADLFAQEFGGSLGVAFGGLNAFVFHLSHIHRLFVSLVSIHNLSGQSVFFDF